MHRNLVRRARAGVAASVLGALLYAAAPPTANAAGLDAAGRAELRGLATGQMAKLVVHDAPRPRMQGSFFDADGAPLGFADFAGKVVVVNFWATWCPPCRAEMPAIDRLAAALADAPVVVLALSTDFGDIAKPRAFLEEIGVERLVLAHDRSRAVAREAAILGLPVTILLDRAGREVARLVGDAHWDDPQAVAVLRRLLALTAGAEG